MKKPHLIQFKNNSLSVLKSRLLATFPEEGCALLIGERKDYQYQKNSIWIVRLIWPTLNVWEPEMLLEPVNQTPKSGLSRNNRFALDPLEQIKAQKWARSKSWNILGNAHSHPKGTCIPSATDGMNAMKPGLMVIVDRSKSVRAWWMDKNQSEIYTEVAIC